MAGGGWIVMTVLWVVVIGLVVWALAALFPRGRGRDEAPREAPEDILDRRFARGEFGAESYRESATSCAPATAHAARTPADIDRVHGS